MKVKANSYRFKSDGPRLHKGLGSSLQTKGLLSPKEAVLASSCGGRGDTASSSLRELGFSSESGGRIFLELTLPAACF